MTFARIESGDHFHFLARKGERCVQSLACSLRCAKGFRALEYKLSVGKIACPIVEISLSFLIKMCSFQLGIQLLQICGGLRRDNDGSLYLTIMVHIFSQNSRKSSFENFRETSTE